MIRFKQDDGSQYPDWNNTTLENLCDGFSAGQTPSRTKKDFFNGTIPWLTSGELNRGKIIDTIEKITKGGQENAHLEIIPKGTFIMAITGLEADKVCGNCAILDIDSTLNQSCMYLIPKKGKLITSYLFQWYLYIGKSYATKYCQGTKQQSYNAEIVKMLPITCPSSTDEQKKIADFLSEVDNMISIQESQLAALEEQKKGAVQKIFSQEVRFKADDGTDFSEWEERQLCDLVDHYGGTALEKFVTPDGTCKFISIGNYSPDGHYIDNGQRINPEGKASDKRLNKNDLVMILNDKTASGVIIGSTILADSDDYIYNQRSERMVCKGNLLPKYMWYYMNSYVVKGKILKLVQGATQIYVNFPTVYELDMTLPHPDEQKKIADFLSDYDKAIEIKRQKLEAWKTMKKGLLQQLFM